MGENLCQLYLRQEINNHNIHRVQKIQLPPMKKWVSELKAEHFQRKKSNDQTSHEEMLNIPGHKGNGNQNHVKVTPHSC
jgi:hypothetical protein